MKKLTFDIMVGDRFYRTMHMPITLDMVEGYENDTPIINLDKVEEYMLQKCPTLKHEKYRICF